MQDGRRPEFIKTDVWRVEPATLWQGKKSFRQDHAHELAALGAPILPHLHRVVLRQRRAALGIHGVEILVPQQKNTTASGSGRGDPFRRMTIWSTNHERRKIQYRSFARRRDIAALERRDRRQDNSAKECFCGWRSGARRAVPFHLFPIG